METDRIDTYPNCTNMSAQRMKGERNALIYARELLLMSNDQSEG